MMIAIECKRKDRKYRVMYIFPNGPFGTHLTKIRTYEQIERDAQKADNRDQALNRLARLNGHPGWNE